MSTLSKILKEKQFYCVIYYETIFVHQAELEVLLIVLIFSAVLCAFVSCFPFKTCLMQ